VYESQRASTISSTSTSTRIPPHRIGRDYFGIPILAPADIPSGSTIFICLEPKLAADIAARYSDPGRHFVVPPHLAI